MQVTEEERVKLIYQGALQLLKDFPDDCVNQAAEWASELLTACECLGEDGQGMACAKKEAEDPLSEHNLKALELALTPLYIKERTRSPIPGNADFLFHALKNFREAYAKELK